MRADFSKRRCFQIRVPFLIQQNAAAIDNHFLFDRFGQRGNETLVLPPGARPEVFLSLTEITGGCNEDR